MFVYFPLYSGFKKPLSLPAESSTQNTTTQQLASSWNDQLEMTFDSEVTDYLPLYKARVEMKWQAGPRVQNGIGSCSINHTSLGASITNHHQPPQLLLPSLPGLECLFQYKHWTKGWRWKILKKKKLLKTTQKSKPNYGRSLDTNPLREKKPTKHKQTTPTRMKTICYYTSQITRLMSI